MAKEGRTPWQRAITMKGIATVLANLVLIWGRRGVCDETYTSFGQPMT
jgi:hypothetical protein